MVSIRRSSAAPPPQISRFTGRTAYLQRPRRRPRPRRRCGLGRAADPRRRLSEQARSDFVARSDDGPSPVIIRVIIRAWSDDAPARPPPPSGTAMDSGPVPLHRRRCHESARAASLAAACPRCSRTVASFAAITPGQFEADIPGPDPGCGLGRRTIPACPAPLIFRALRGKQLLGPVAARGEQPGRA